MPKAKVEKNQVSELKLLHQVVTKNYHSEIDLFNEYLLIGKNILKFETGIVSRIKNDSYTVLAFSSPLEGLAIDQVFPLEDTYCREVFRSKQTVAFSHVGSVKKMCEHPVYLNMKLESYISSPLFVNGEIYGTLNFTDRLIREGGFSTHEHELMEIMAKTVGRFLEAKLAKEELQNANAKISRLVGVVAHDLNNPLGNIISLVDMINDEKNEEIKLSYLNMIEKSAFSSMEMIKSILNMNAIENGKIKIIKKENAMKKLLEDSWDEVHYLALKKSISHKIVGDEAVFNFDRERMKQVICNLLTNAIKFSKPDSQILSTLKLSNGVFTLIVKDEGVGMSAKQMETIFDPLKKTSTLGTEGEMGTGYGLPLVYEIILNHNGDVKVDSSLKGGSSFIITLPLV